MGNNITFQRLECYYRSFSQGLLNNRKERPSIRKDRISNCQNSQRIPEWEKSSYFKFSQIIRDKRPVDLIRKILCKLDSCIPKIRKI